MRLKGVDWRQLRKWKREKEENGYCPHYHRMGRIKMEVRFYPDHSKKFWRVLNLATGQFHIFTKSGHPLSPGTRGRLVGPVILKRRIKSCV